MDDIFALSSLPFYYAWPQRKASNVCPNHFIIFQRRCNVHYAHNLSVHTTLSNGFFILWRNSGFHELISNNVFVYIFINFIPATSFHRLILEGTIIYFVYVSDFINFLLATFLVSSSSRRLFFDRCDRLSFFSV